MTTVGEPYEPGSLRRLHTYWRSKCRGDRLPGRQDIDPTDLPDLLPNLFLFDVEASEAGRRYRFRLTGTGFDKTFGNKLTGQWADEIAPPGRTRPLIAACEEAVTTKRPHFWRNVLTPPNRAVLRYQRLVCPLSTDGETVDMLIGLFAVDERHGNRYSRPLARREQIKLL